jgi:alginate O-acetyltransferase complex protein AlgI
VLFNSIFFLSGFLPISLAVTFLTQSRFRNLPIVALSLLFYGWGEPSAFYVVLVSIALNFVLGDFVGRYRAHRRGKVFLFVGVAANILLLASFKYLQLIVHTWNLFLPSTALSTGFASSLEPPLGISFFTFHGLSYLIDVHRGLCAQRKLSAFMLYVLFFPQLIAGPIVRYSQIQDQLGERLVTWDDWALGLRRLIIGLAKKLLIADLLSGPADKLFALSPAELTPAAAWLGMTCFALQIYFDFSGYSDMAIGLARLFGFRFPENFDHPYAALSMKDFWRRWHISLSTWFRDYVYKPMGGSRSGARRTYLNLTIVFLLCGLWHGASWLFAAWGLFHGFFLVLERTGFGALLERSARPLRRIYVGLVMIVSWIIFRATSVEQAWNVFLALVGIHAPGARDALISLGWGYDTTLATFAAVALCVPAWPRLRGTGTAPAPFDLGRACYFVGLLFICALFLAARTHRAFVYFRF